jgi:histidyl-tRNA synthetase
VGCDSVADDVEAIACAHAVLTSLCSSLSPAPQSLPRLLINTLGTAHDRSCYRQLLAAHLSANAAALSPDSLQRVQRGAVLRVLDSKHPADAAVISSAPCMSSSLSRDSEDRLQAVLHGLALLRVPFTVDRRLVRGLDYYTSTAFEFVVGEGKACNAVLAGGRYDLGQVLQGGARGHASGSGSVPAIGWALGVDRFLALFPSPPPPPPPTVTVIAGPGSTAADSASPPDAVWNAERQAALLVCARLREQGLVTILDCEGANLKKAMARANKCDPVAAAPAHCTHLTRRRRCSAVCVIVGEDELARGQAVVRCMQVRAAHASFANSAAGGGFVWRAAPAAF